MKISKWSLGWIPARDSEWRLVRSRRSAPMVCGHNAAPGGHKARSLSRLTSYLWSFSFAAYGAIALPTSASVRLDVNSCIQLITIDQSEPRHGLCAVRFGWKSENPGFLAGVFVERRRPGSNRGITDLQSGEAL